MHFFDQQISTARIRNFLKTSTANPPDEEVAGLIDDAYIGFMVVKPLPETVIGRTCLRTYVPEGRREYPTTRLYTANLFGLDLEVKTLAFQEQDQTVSACATSCLWSLLQGTSVLFQHKELSPVQITTAASARVPTQTRSLPSDGLTFIQMADVIRSVGLESVAIEVEDEFVFRSTVFAYLYAGIPVAMCIGEGDTDEERETNLHAVTVTGFSLGRQITKCNCGDTNCRFLLRSSQIDELYSHDDQVGPFAKMVIQQGKTDGKLEFVTPIGDEDSVTSRPFLMIIPLYHKIRILFKEIFEAIHEFDHYFRFCAPESFDRDLEWQIVLAEVNELKRSIYWERDFSPINRSDVLRRRLSRYMWRASAYYDQQPFLELLFDATDIEQGRLFLGPIEHDPELAAVLSKMAETLFEAKGQSFGEEPAGTIFSWYLNRT